MILNLNFVTQKEVASFKEIWGMKNSNALMGASFVWSFMNFALKVPVKLFRPPLFNRPAT